MRNNFKLCLFLVIACSAIAYGICNDGTTPPESLTAEVVSVVKNDGVSSSLIPQTLKSLGMVSLFLGALLLLSWYVRKRAGNFALHNSKRIKILDRVALDMRHSVVLISVDERKYVIGIGPQSTSVAAETGLPPTIKEPPA